MVRRFVLWGLRKNSFVRLRFPAEAKEGCGKTHFARGQSPAVAKAGMILLDLWHE
jgi:hypothetical protein